MRNAHRFRLPLLAAFLALAASATGSASDLRHGVLVRGQVLELDGKTLVVCIGSEDGARIGQLLDVVRHVRAGGSPKQAGHRYRRESIGSVRIASLFDGHYATATVVTGTPSVHDTVELRKK